MTFSPWSLAVSDMAGRKRDLTVRVEDGEIVIATPTPGIARLTGPEASLYIAALIEARNQVFVEDAPPPPQRPGR